VLIMIWKTDIKLFII